MNEFALAQGLAVVRLLSFAPPNQRALFRGRLARVCVGLQPLVSRADRESLAAARNGKMDVGCALIEVTSWLARPL